MYYDVSQLMAEPVTPQETLLKDKDDMKVRMELLIMKIQVIKLGKSFFNDDTNKRVA